MITDNHRKEGLSAAFIQAVTAQAGWKLGSPALHDYGLDHYIHYVQIVENERYETGHTLCVQAKATQRFRLVGDHVHYPLEVRAYNHLVRTNLGSPCILVVYCMPDDEAEWLRVNSDVTQLKHCGYWISLRGMPKSENAETVTVRIPKSQVFCPTALTEIMGRLFQGALP